MGLLTQPTKRYVQNQLGYLLNRLAILHARRNKA